jgi:hypothetical protein
VIRKGNSESESESGLRDLQFGEGEDLGEEGVTMIGGEEGFHHLVIGDEYNRAIGGNKGATELL